MRWLTGKGDEIAVQESSTMMKYRASTLSSQSINIPCLDPRTLTFSRSRGQYIGNPRSLCTALSWRLQYKRPAPDVQTLADLDAARQDWRLPRLRSIIECSVDENASPFSGVLAPLTGIGFAGAALNYVSIVWVSGDGGFEVSGEVFGLVFASNIHGFVFFIV